MSDCQYEYGNETEEKHKPKERYIPPEPSDDENVVFGSGISSGINFDKYDKIKVIVTGENPIKPINRFQQCGLRSVVLENLSKSGYNRPTPVQKHSFPIVLDGRDLMACAQTGSGKTAAYLVPIVNTLLSHSCELIMTEESVEPQALIISPTRELAIQIFTEARKFSHGSFIKTAVAYGGTATYRQALNLMKGCHILVATPGRMNDFVSKGRISFSSVKFVVLDEADRMLDLGFLPSIEKMFDHPSMVPVGRRQTLMFSATFPVDIQKLASKHLNNYLFLAVGIVGGACDDVEQIIYEVTKFEKKEKLTEIIGERLDAKQLTLVFVEQKRTADFIAAYLSENGILTTSIHGDRLQSQREQALLDFKTGHMPTLVATAVAARGLDIKNVSHVINFDLPSTIDEYVHRIGRTGRVGNRGKATSFYDPDYDNAIAKDLLKILEQCNQKIPSFLMGNVRNVSAYRSKENYFSGRDVRSNVFNKSRGSDDESFSRGGGICTRIEEEEEEW